jgi:hypothetical protein
MDFIEAAKKIDRLLDKMSHEEFHDLATEETRVVMVPLSLPKLTWLILEQYAEAEGEETATILGMMMKELLTAPVARGFRRLF